MFRAVIYSLFIFSLYTLNGCTSTTEPAGVKDGYVILKAGTVKQFYNYSDSTYTNEKIYGIVTREDGQEVYILGHNNSSPYSHLLGYSYCFIRNDYYYFTQLVKDVNSVNPFREYRLGKVYPNDGDSWYSDEDTQNPERNYFTAHYIGQMKVPAGTFQNVYDFQYYDPTIEDTLHAYYAEGIGSIGSIHRHNKIFLNYALIGDRSYGKQIPAALLP